MTTAKPPARYSAMESARSGDFTTQELHPPRDTTICVVDGSGLIVKEVRAASEPEALIAA